LVSQPPHESIKHQRDTPKLNMWCGIIGLFLFQEATVERHLYPDMLGQYTAQWSTPIFWKHCPCKRFSSMGIWRCSFWSCPARLSDLITLNFPLDYVKNIVFRRKLLIVELIDFAQQIRLIYWLKLCLWTYGTRSNILSVYVKQIMVLTLKLTRWQKKTLSSILLNSYITSSVK
jgi:hypothetical protein